MSEGTFSQKTFLSGRELAALFAQHPPLTNEPTPSHEQEKREPQLRFTLETGGDRVTAPYRLREQKPCQDRGFANQRTGLIAVCDGLGSGGASELVSEVVTDRLSALTAQEQQESFWQSFFSSDVNTQTFTPEEAVNAGRALLEELNRVAYTTKASPAVKERCTAVANKNHLEAFERAILKGNPHPPSLSQAQFEKRVQELIDCSDTTVSFAKLFQTPTGEAKILIGNVGDSRIYRRRKGTWSAISRDHGIAQTLIELGHAQDEMDDKKAITRQTADALLASEKDALERMPVTTGSTGAVERILCESRVSALKNLIGTFERHGNPPFLTLGDLNFQVFQTLGFDATTDTSHTYVLDVEEGDEYYAFTDGIFEVLIKPQLEQVRERVSSGALPDVCRAFHSTIVELIITDPANHKDDDMTSEALRVSIQKRTALPTPSAPPLE